MVTVSILPGTVVVRTTAVSTRDSDRDRTVLPTVTRPGTDKLFDVEDDIFSEYAGEVEILRRSGNQRLSSWINKMG
jgi:hypothetical protein